MTKRARVNSREYSFTAVFEPAEEGDYVVSFPALPGCLTQGETLAEARRMAAEALAGYLETLVARGRCA
jgi:predicted RNase H-like HicB family nuclease